MQHPFPLALVCLLLACSPAAPEVPDSEPPGSESEPCDASSYVLPSWDPAALSPEQEIDPADTDPAIDEAPQQRHFAYLPSGLDPRGELLVLLSGSNQGANEATDFATLAAGLGYHVLSLGYLNQDSVNNLCQQEESPSQDCHGDVLQEKVYGTDSSPLLDVDPPNSVLGRISAAVDFLASTAPDEGWEQFLDGGELDWARIAVAGGSQGGKISAYLSRDFAAARAVLLSAMGSAYNDGGVPDVADWSRVERATPPERTFGLWHAQEAADQYAPAILEAYGVDALGPVVDVDSQPPPYGCSHQLRTNLLPSSGDMADAHASLGMDSLQAMDGDLPALTPTRIYMLTWED